MQVGGEREQAGIIGRLQVHLCAAPAHLQPHPTLGGGGAGSCPECLAQINLMVLYSETLLLRCYRSQ